MSEYQHARQIKAAHEREIMALPGVTGCFTGTKTVAGHDTGQVAIVVCVDRKRDVPASDRVPPTLDGVPTDVIEETVTPVADTARYSPLKGGIGFSAVAAPQTTGTLGCLVRTTDTSELMALSCYHVLAETPGWTAGGHVVQPAIADGGVDGADTIGTVQRATIGSNVDAAACTLSGRAAQAAIAQIGSVMGSATAAVGMFVRKRGRTTGLTWGWITATDYSFSLNYSSLGGGLGTYSYTNQVRIAIDPASPRFVDVGDSGSAVVDQQGRVVGLLFGQGDVFGNSAVANPIASVLSALSLAIEVPTTPVGNAVAYQQAVEVLRQATTVNARAYQQAVEVLLQAPAAPAAKPRSFAVFVG